MDILETQINPNDERYQANAAHNRTLAAELRERLALVRQGGGEQYRQRHTEQGKLFVRDRIDRLIDPGSPFLEIAPLAAWELYEDNTPSAGIMTGIGRVSGVECVIVANDATVKGGTYYPMTVKKHLRAQQIALKQPALYLSRGQRRRVSANAGRGFPRRGRFRTHLLQSGDHERGRYPADRAVMGSCTAGGAYVPAMCDETVIVNGTGTIFLGGPPLVKAATGEEVSAEELGGAYVHTHISGVADHFAEDDDHALEIVRNIVATLNREVQPKTSPAYPPEDPLYDPQELYGICRRLSAKPMMSAK